ncbi:MAG TPA: amidohydrolase family protein [Opitutaceae bacterium]|nr:amidohydrolase family protein [Opitutaceae bacterium]
MINPALILRIFLSSAVLIAINALLASPRFAANKLLVKNAFFITPQPDQNPFLGYMVVDSDGRIVEIAPGDAPASAQAVEILDVHGKFVAPGFISAHSHLFMSPLRGLGQDETLYGWLSAINKINHNSSPEDIYWFSLHGALDFLRNGITTAYDFTYSGALGGGSKSVGIGEKNNEPTEDPEPYEQAQIRAKIDSGIRFINSISIVALGSEDEMRQRFERVLAFAKKYSDNPRFLKMAISGWVQLAPSKDAAYREAKYMKDYGLINQAHFLESPERVSEQQAKFAWYKESGALGPNFIFGHFIQTTPEIVKDAAAAGARMCWQPTSNGRLASGVADIPAYRAAGMKIGVGLDDQSCTDISDPFQNLRMGIYLIRSRYKDAKVMTAKEMLYLHTLGGAEILGIADKVGSLEKGKFADFLVVDPRNPDTGPIHDPMGTYVLACGLRNLQQVYVGGELTVNGINFSKQNPATLSKEVDSRIARLRHSAGLQ